MPRHVAIIMDGNGRWAKARGLPRAEGHRRGVEAVRRTVQAAMELSIPYLTLFSFSSENWSRPASEIDDLMGLMKRFIRRDLAELHQKGVRVKVIGGTDNVDSELLGLIAEAQKLTADNHAIDLIIAFNYGARAEITHAVQRIAERVERGEMRASAISSEDIAGALDTAGIPDPDLLIRTSGEMRLSNFLLWQCAYTEFVFIDAHWPEFGRDWLERAVSEYMNRSRRFGGLTARTIG